MAFVPPQYERFSKAVWGFADASWDSKKDNVKPFKSEFKIESGAKTADGVVVKTGVSANLPKPDDGFVGNGSAEFSIKDVGKVTVAAKTTGLKDCSIGLEGKGFIKNAISSLSTSNEEIVAKASWSKESIAANASFTSNFIKNEHKGTFAVSGGFDGFALGAQANFEVPAKLTEVDAGFTYSKKDAYSVCLNSRNFLGEARTDITSLGGLYTLDSKTTLGGLLMFRISNASGGFPEDKRWCYVAAERVLDASTTVKAKAELLNKGQGQDLTLSVTHKLENPAVRLGFSAVFNPLENLKNKGIKFSAAFGDC